MVFKKKFGQSLIQAYCIQILLLLMSGMVFHNLYDGILVGGIVSLLGWLYSWRSDKEYFAEHFRMIYRDMSVVAFLLLSGFVFTINYGKHYSQWDEFSHWGRFIENAAG